MPIDLKDYIVQVEAVASRLEVETPDLIFGFGQDLVDSIINRIQNDGVGPDGSPFKSYSPAYLRFKSNPQNYKAGKDLGLGSSRYTGKVDYTLTGEMFRNIGLVEESRTDETIKLSWGGRNDTTRKKLRSLSDRDGDVFSFSNEEESNALADLNSSIERIIEPIV